MLAGVLPVYLGDFFERSQADLQPFFAFHPWLYLFLIPALSMRPWAEERMSRAIGLADAVLGKFLAAWCVAGFALVLTFPFWLTVNLLGEPDNGAILAGYLASWLMAGAMLAIGAAVSAAITNRIIASFVTGALLFALIVAGTPAVLGLFRGWAPEGLIGAVAATGILGHFTAIARGVIDLRDIVYFVSLIVAFLGISAILVDLKKAD